MEEFAKLLENIIFSPSRNKKINLLVDYFRRTPNPERGYALSLLTSNFKFRYIRNSDLKEITKSRIDSTLFELSYDYVGDMAETISLIWPNKTQKKLPSLTEFVNIIQSSSKESALKFLIRKLDESTQTERWAIIKLFTGGLRIGISEKIVKISLSKFGDKRLDQIEKIWHGLQIPYLELFEWLENKGPLPEIDVLQTFHPLMLAHPLNVENEFKNLVPDDFIAEWKWDGTRVQVIISDTKTIIFSRSGDNITNSFPELKFNSKVNVVLDGELLVGNNLIPQPFNQVQQRLNRKTISKNLLQRYPAFIRLYDIIILDFRDQREKTLLERRFKLEEWYRENPNNNLDLSEILKFSNWNDLKTKRNKALLENDVYEGIMIKKKNSLYSNGRPKGMWYKWKRDPKFIDVVLMYAQRGHGKRSSFYSDFTFGVWDENKLVPIGKAYSGFTDIELNKIDNFVRRNISNKFGPVREVNKKLVFEIAFDSISESRRHKSGLALRFPRISRIRWDKKPKDADTLKMVKSTYKIG